MVYCKRLCRNETNQLADACAEFVDSAFVLDPQLLNKPKFHLFLHLPNCIEDFGRIALFNAER